MEGGTERDYSVLHRRAHIPALVPIFTTQPLTAVAQSANYRIHGLQMVTRTDVFGGGVARGRTFRFQ